MRTKRGTPLRLERLDVHLTVAERVRLFEMAREQGLAASELVRRSVFGPALPEGAPPANQPNYDDERQRQRIWFAGHALPALIALYGEDRTWPQYAALAFDYADAMVEEAAS